MAFLASFHTRSPSRSITFTVSLGPSPPPMNSILPLANMTGEPYSMSALKPSPPLRFPTWVQPPPTAVLSDWVRFSGPDMKTEPLVSTCKRGYQGRSLNSKLSFQRLSFQICGLVLNLPSSLVPEQTRTPPSGRQTAVGYQRPPFISSTGSHELFM